MENEVFFLWDVVRDDFFFTSTNFPSQTVIFGIECFTGLYRLKIYEPFALIMLLDGFRRTCSLVDFYGPKPS